MLRKITNLIIPEILGGIIMATTIKDENTVKLEGVLSKGYGIVPKLVMKDKDLTAEAKAIYAYLASYAGGGETAFPSVSLICEDLGFGKNRFYTHRKNLIEKGYIKVERKRKEKGFSNNIYTLVQTVCIQNEDIGNDDSQTVRLQNEDIQNEDIQNRDIQNRDTNKNRSNNNSLNNNSINNNNHNQEKKEPVVVYEPKNQNSKNENQEPKNQKSSVNSELKELSNFYQENFGMISPHILDDVTHWASDIGYELTLEAMKRAVENQKNYSYAKGIMRQWMKNGVKTLEDVEAADVAFNNRRRNNFGNASPTKKESLPDWAKEDNQQPVSVNKDKENKDSEVEQDFADRLARIRAMREEKDV